MKYLVITTFLFTFLLSPVDAIPGSGQSKSNEASELSRPLLMGEPSSSDFASTSGANTEIKFHKCSADQQAHINEVVIVAEEMIDKAISYLKKRKPDDKLTRPKVYITWFGKYDPAGHQTVSSKVELLRKTTRSFTYDCQACSGRSAWPAAYLFLNNGSFQINLCPKFWDKSVAKSTQAGLIIHELLRAQNIATIVDRGGPKEVKLLAIDQPGQAVKNVANIKYFIEEINTPASFWGLGRS